MKESIATTNYGAHDQGKFGASLMILLDTNILLRSIEPLHAMYKEAVDALAALVHAREELCIVAQNLYEFWVVATRPKAQNGLGLLAAEALAHMVQFQSVFRLLADTGAILPAWQQLIQRTGITGKNAHDVRLVAAMQIHGVTRFLTFNPADFQRFPGITVLTPQDVLATPAPPAA